LPAVIEAKLQQFLQPLTVPRPVTQPPPNVKPKLNFSTHPSAKQVSSVPSTNQSMTLASQRNYGSESNLLDALSSSADGTTGDDGNWPRTGMRNAGSVPDLLSPQGGHFSEEPPPLPPERPVASAEKPDATSGVSQPGYYDAPGIGDAFYNTPPIKYQHQSNTADFYNVPPVTYFAETDNDVGNACYDIPPVDEADKQLAKKAGKKAVHEVTGGDVYNVPPAHSADDSWSSAGSPAREFYQNVPSSSGKKSRNARGARRTGSLDNENAFSQTASVCLADQTYDIPSAEQRGGKLASHGAMSSPVVTDETYDTPPRNEVNDKKNQPQKPTDKRSVNFRPLTGISDQTYDTPPASESVVNTPYKPHRGKPRSSLEPSEAARHSEQLSAQETYSVPPTAQHPSAATKPPVGTRTQRQTAALTDEMYDVPPASSSNRTSASVGADLSSSSLSEEQTYNVPASCVPPIPAKRNPAPPPKPPRPRVSLAARTSDTAVSTVQESAKAVSDVSEKESSEKDTVAELPRIKGMIVNWAFLIKLFNYPVLILGREIIASRNCHHDWEDSVFVSICLF